MRGEEAIPQPGAPWTRAAMHELPKDGEPDEKMCAEVEMSAAAGKGMPLLLLWWQLPILWLLLAVADKSS